MGNPSSQCWPANFQGPVRTTYDTVRRMRVLCPVIDTPCPLKMTLTLFPTVSAGSSKTERINRALNLAQSLSSFLMKCNPPSPNIIHHTPAFVLVCEHVCFYTECLSVSASPCLCFHFPSYRLQAPKQSSNSFNSEDKTNKPAWPICFLAFALFGTNLIHLISCLLDSYHLYLIYMWSYTTQGCFQCWFM